MRFSRWAWVVLPLCWAVSGWAGEPAAIDTVRAVAADGERDNWLLHGRTYDEKRYSPLTDINDGNVNELRLAWYFDTGHNRGLEATPLVIDGVMYSTGNWSVVYAHDAQTGELLWRYDPQVDRAWAVHACCDVVNRGVAAWQGRLYVGTLDGRLVAIDAASGEKVWETLTIDTSKPYTITGAPRIVKGKVLIGNGGAEYGVRGYVSAYDAETGEQVWRFYTVPGNPADGFENPLMEEIAKTWSGEWWQLGGGGGTVWDSMAYDPELDLLYIGVGNAGPWNRYLRNPEGKDNLFTASIVALRPDTGEYVWHYQETPNDGWDYTSTQHIILADIIWQGELRQVILHAPKNGFFFIVDRRSGQFLSAEPYARVNWALGYDESGRPIENPAASYKDKPAFVRPSPMGAHNWQPMSYSTQTGLVYIPAMDGLMEMKQDKNFSHKPGFWNMGLEPIKVPPIGPSLNAILNRKVTGGSLLAWDPVKQQKVWEVKHPLTWNGGVLSTAGNLVFQGTADGRLVAYRATDGEALWQMDVQAGVIAPPVTYRVAGEQYVALQVGWGGAYGLAAGLPPPPGVPKSRIMAFKLGGASAALPPREPRQFYDPPAPLTDNKAILEHGEYLYNSFCQGCHGVGVVSNGAIPDLRWMAPAYHDNFHAIVLGGALKGVGMVSFAEVLSDKDADAIRAYIVREANTAVQERDNPGPEWWVRFKHRAAEWLGDMIAKYL